MQLGTDEKDGAQSRILQLPGDLAGAEGECHAKALEEACSSAVGEVENDEAELIGPEGQLGPPRPYQPPKRSYNAVLALASHAVPALVSLALGKQPGPLVYACLRVPLPRLAVEALVDGPEARPSRPAQADPNVGRCSAFAEKYKAILETELYRRMKAVRSKVM